MGLWPANTTQSVSKHRNVGGAGIICSQQPPFDRDAESQSHVAVAAEAAAGRPRWRGTCRSTSTEVSIGMSVGK